MPAITFYYHFIHVFAQYFISLSLRPDSFVELHKQSQPIVSLQF